MPVPLLLGVRHEGTPEGKYEEINGIKTYVATPTKDYPKDKALIYICDIYGLELPNNLVRVHEYSIKYTVADFYAI